MTIRNRRTLRRHSTIAEFPPWDPGHPEASESVERFRQTLRGSLEGHGAWLVGSTLGRYELRQWLGSGGMAAVYRAVDSNGGRDVAIKVLNPNLLDRSSALDRFRKEARLLSAVNLPGVTELYEIHQDEAVPYLVLELVDGPSLADVVAERGSLDERLALNLMIRVVEALAGLHPRGIVHRDIKPANILLDARALRDFEQHSQPWPEGAVKLTDFGLARHVTQSGSLDLTRSNAVVGTPTYLAPEQCTGNVPVGATADVYALGATLFHLLTGRPPFEAEPLLDLLEAHRHRKPVLAYEINPAVSESFSHVVAKALEKRPELRYADAAELLGDLERLRDGVPIKVAIHPALPARDPDAVLEYILTCELESSPQQLWPYVANTERINRAAGLPPVEFTVRTSDDGQLRQYGKVHWLGLHFRWLEHPFEWVERQRMSVLREFQRGPFRWLNSEVELRPRPTGGTILQHRFQLEPRGWLGRAVADLQVGVRSRGAFRRVYQRIDAVLSSRADRDCHQDPYLRTGQLSQTQQQRLETAAEQLVAQGAVPDVVLKLSDYLAHAAAQELSSLHPFLLARRWGLARDQVLDTFLLATHLGLLRLRWEIHCPICRIAAAQRDTLSAVESHGHCDVCHVDFKTDFAHAVELVFWPDPHVRASEFRTYCTGGPAHFGHVIAQARIGAGGQARWGLSLPPGSYRATSPLLSTAVPIQVSEGEVRTAADINLRPREPASTSQEQPSYTLGPEHQLLTITNRFDRELTVRVERDSAYDDVITASRVASLARFRELFPEQTLGIDRPVAIAELTCLVTQAVFSTQPDKRALSPSELELQRCVAVQAHLRRLGGLASATGGALIKTIGDGALVVFPDVTRARKVANELLRDASPSLQWRVAIGQGPAVLATVNGTLDYFGSTVNRTIELAREATPGELTIAGNSADELAAEQPLAHDSQACHKPR